MKTLVTVCIPFLSLCLAAGADDLSTQAWQLESKGDGTGARELLEQAARRGPADALAAYAQFLDRHGDPAAREAYEKALNAVRGEQRKALARRLVVLDMVSGDRN